jgi:hypothetical protein
VIIITIKELKLIIREILSEKRQLTKSKKLIKKSVELDEVDTDPSNNPGRPADAYDYIGMRPNAAWAMSHPSLSGGGSVDTQ